VLATVAGKQRKKITRTEEEANLVANQWMTAQESDLQVLPTRLKPSQLKEAEAAVTILESAGFGLLDGARWLLAHYSRPAKVAWLTALSGYESDRLRSGTTAVQVNNVVRATKRLANHLKRPEIGDLSAGEVRAFLDSAIASDAEPATFNGLLGGIRTFCRWCVTRKYVQADPTDGMERRKIRRGLPEVLTPDRAESLVRDVEATEPAWIPYLALCLFGGIRPGTRAGEACRLDDDLRNGRKVFHPGGVELKGKANGVRILPWRLTGPLREWLDCFSPSPGLWPCETTTQAERAWAKIRERHGLSSDILRHTAISAMAYAPGASLAALAIAAGNSEAVIRRNYLGRWSPEDTVHLWAIKPALDLGFNHRSQSDVGHQGIAHSRLS
jgi:integrase